MPLSRRAEAPRPAPADDEEDVPRPRATTRGSKYPRRATIFGVLRDESGSMSGWRDKQGTFIPGLRDAITEAGGPRVADLVHILYGVVSGEVTFAEIAPLSAAKDPVFEPDLMTPIGQGLKAFADKLDAFTDELHQHEVAVRAVKVAVISDLKPTGESEAETEAGVKRFLEVMKKCRADVQLVGPSEADMNQELAHAIDVSGHGVVYLDSSDPKAVFKWTFDSILSQSRKLDAGTSRKK